MDGNNFFFFLIYMRISCTVYIVFTRCFSFVGSAGNEKSNNEGLFPFFSLIRLYVWSSFRILKAMCVAGLQTTTEMLVNATSVRILKILFITVRKSLYMVLFKCVRFLHAAVNAVWAVMPNLWLILIEKNTLLTGSKTGSQTELTVGLINHRN